MRQLSLCLLLLCCPIIAAFASLSPDKQAAKYDHLFEVNAQWLWASAYYDASEMAMPAVFTTDNDRIHTHLLMVVDALRAEDVNALNATQRLNRAALLDVLERYAKASIFPANHYHDQRQPYFIDNFDVPCAVGHLIIESGQAELAYRVHEENNYAYIHELVGEYPALTDWAVANGFTIDELALIQPGYPPPNSWSSVGEGLNGSVTDMASNNLDLAYVVGDFTTVDGVYCQGVAQLTEFGLLPLSTGVAGTVHTVEMMDGYVYVAGELMKNGTSYNIARWDGANWWYTNAYTGKVNDLYASDNYLYAVGDKVARTSTNAVSWQTLANSVNGDILAVHTFGNQIAVAGNFTSIDGVSAQKVAAYSSGSWSELGGGLGINAHALCVMGGELYVGGGFVYGSLATPADNGLLRYTGTDWVNVLMTPDVFTDLGDAIYHLNSFEDMIIFSGDMNLSSMFTLADGIGVYKKNHDTFRVLAASTNGVYGSCILNGSLYMGTASNSVTGEFFVESNINYLGVSEITVDIQLNARLEGPLLNSGTSTMATTILDSDLLPNKQPFGGYPWYYDGEEALPDGESFPSNVVDWVLIEIRSPADPNFIFDTRAALLLTDGSVVDVRDPSGDDVSVYFMSTGARYLVLRHRSHLAVITDTYHYFPNSSSLDMCDPDIISGGAEQVKWVNGDYALCAGDVNSDGVISVHDFNQYVDESSIINAYLDADVNLDRAVTVSDFNAYKENGSRIAVPIVRYDD